MSSQELSTTPPLNSGGSPTSGAKGPTMCYEFVEMKRHFLLLLSYYSDGIVSKLLCVSGVLCYDVTLFFVSFLFPIKSPWGLRRANTEIAHLRPYEASISPVPCPLAETGPAQRESARTHICLVYIVRPHWWVFFYCFFWADNLFIIRLIKYAFLVPEHIFGDFFFVFFLLVEQIHTVVQNVPSICYWATKENWPCNFSPS